MSTPAVKDRCAPEAIYERCGCDPADSAYPAAHFIIDGVGWTCDRGLIYLVCSSCCSGTTNTAVCEASHHHGIGRPWCQSPVRIPDVAALSATAHPAHDGHPVL